MHGGHSSSQTWSKCEDAASVAKAWAALLQAELIKEKETFSKKGNQAPMSSNKTPTWAKQRERFSISKRLENSNQ